VFCRRSPIDEKLFQPQYLLLFGESRYLRHSRRVQEEKQQQQHNNNTAAASAKKEFSTTITQQWQSIALGHSRQST